MNDNHIIPRCPKCGSETDRLGFFNESSKITNLTRERNILFACVLVLLLVLFFLSAAYIEQGRVAEAWLNEYLDISMKLINK